MGYRHTRNEKKMNKTYSIDGMKPRDVAILIETMESLGFGNDDFRIMHFKNSMELKVTNRKLHWILKSMSKLRRLRVHTKTKAPF